MNPFEPMPKRSVAEIMEQAKEIIPELLTILQRRAGRDSLVAISALATALDVIIDSGHHAMQDDEKALKEFDEDVTMVEEMARKYWKNRE